MAIAVDDTPDLAFERLYERHVTDVYRYVLAVLRNPADAEDVTQTTFMNAYRAMKRGERPEKPQNWLITIAHNACRTRYIRASRRPQEVPLEVGTDDVAMPETEKPNVRAVLQALSELPFNQRSALVMRELEGRSYDEIATALGVTVPAVEMLIFRARRSLRLQRGSLKGVIGLVPLPASLATFGGGTAAVGGAALGLLGTIGKIAAVVAALAVGGAAGYEAAGVKIPSGQHRNAVRAVQVAAKGPSGPVARPRQVAANGAARREVTLRPAATRVRVRPSAQSARPRPASHTDAASAGASSGHAVPAATHASSEPRAADSTVAAASRSVATTVAAVRGTVQTTVQNAVDGATQLGKTVVDTISGAPSKVTQALPPLPVTVETLPAVTVPPATVPTVVPDPIAAPPVSVPAPPIEAPAPPTVTTPTVPSLP